MDDVIRKFEALADCHKDGLVEAAGRGGDAVIWWNLCKVYGFEEKDREGLKEYIRRRSAAAGRS